jgi:membrane protease YdiL (CAAX protease family)
MNGPLPKTPQTATPSWPPLHGGDILRTILIGFGLFFGMNFVLAHIVATAGGGRVNAQIASFAAWTFSWLAAIWFVFVRGRGLSFADLGYTIVDRRWALMGIGAGFGALPLAFVLVAILRPALGSDTAPSVEDFTGGGDFTVFHALTMLLYGGFVVPLTEELFFRGLVFRWLRQRLDFWPAAFVSAAVFGVAHGSADKAVISGLLGLALAWLFERSRSLAPAILLHQTFNSLALMLTFAVIWLPSGPET